MRPRSHQLESQSRIAFDQALPASWVTRDLNPDYGVDKEVEIFETDGSATGLTFGVQLKATDTEGPEALRVPFTHDKVGYYRSLHDPILVVRYLASSGELYARWLHSFDPYYEPTSERGITMVFSTADKWESATPNRLREGVAAFRRFRGSALQLPVQFAVFTETDPLHGKTRSEWSVAIGVAAEPLSDVVMIGNLERTSVIPTIELRVDSIAANIGGVASITFHNDPQLTGVELDARPFDALAAIGLAFDHLGHADLAARVLRLAAPKSHVVLVPEAALMIASTFARARRVREALEVAEALADRTEEEAGAASSIMSVAALHAAPNMSADERDAYDRFLIARIERLQSQEGRGQAHYSFANFLRTSRRPRKAIRHYRLALTHDPGYTERPYFWREVGSCLFLEQRYVWAVEALERAVDLGDRVETRALHGDALFFAGEFRRAEEVLGAYLDEHPGEAEWRLKRTVLPEVRARFGDVRNRDVEVALQLADGATEDERRQLAALDEDPLCGLAWFNYGVLLFSVERHEESLFAFLMTALIQSGDVEAWCNAIALAMGENALPLAADIIEAAYRANGEAVLVQFAEMLRSQPDGPADPEILEALTGAVRALPADEEPFELRVVEQGTGAYESLPFWRRQPDEESEPSEEESPE